MKLKKRILFIVLVLLSVSSYATELKKVKKDTLSSEGVYLGINFGMYFANNQSANYYNGSGTNSLYNTIFQNTYNYNAIKQSFNNRSFSFDSTSLPQNMKYDLAINIGFHFRRTYLNSMFFFMQTSYSKLKTSDYVMFTVQDSVAQLAPPVIKQNTITGEESRVDFEIGIGKTFTHNRVRPFAGVGINMNNVKFIKSMIEINNQQYSLQNYYDAYYNIQQGGIGFGIITMLGLEIKINKSAMLSIGSNISYKRISLGTNGKTLLNSIVYAQLIVNAANIL